MGTTIKGYDWDSCKEHLIVQEARKPISLSFRVMLQTLSPKP